MLSSVLAASGGDSGTAAGSDSDNNASKSGSGSNSGKAVLTVKEYDLQELRRMGSAVFFECVSASYMHFVTKVRGWMGECGCGWG